MYCLLGAIIKLYKLFQLVDTSWHHDDDPQPQYHWVHLPANVRKLALAVRFAVVVNKYTPWTLSCGSQNIRQASPEHTLNLMERLCIVHEFECAFSSTLKRYQFARTEGKNRLTEIVITRNLRAPRMCRYVCVWRRMKFSGIRLAARWRKTIASRQLIAVDEWGKLWHVLDVTHKLNVPQCCRPTQAPIS